jgi:hypothetical protein
MKEATARRTRRPTPAIGDEVRVPVEVRNEFVGYEHSSGLEGTREPVGGLVVSIRDISSGERVKVAAGEARRYVLDLLHHQTFDPRVSSKTNSQGVTAGRVQEGSTYAQVQKALRGQAARAASSTAADLLGQPPFSNILDGWRLVRVCAASVEVTEPGEG